MSSDEIDKLKTTLTTSQILNFNGAHGTNKLDVWILPLRWRRHSAT